MSELSRVLVVTAQGFVSLVFVAAAAHKLRDSRRFAAVMSDYRVLPVGLVPAVVPLVVFAEAAIAAGVWFESTRIWSGVGAGVLLSVYAVAIAINLARGRSEIECGCTWGATGQPISFGLVSRNAVLLVPCAAVVWGAAPTGRSVGEVVLAGVAALVLFVSLRTFETLAGHAPALRRLGG